MNQENLRELTNPAFNTASAMLLHLQMLGAREAEVLADALGLKVQDVFSEQQIQSSLSPANQINIEVRYADINDILKNSPQPVVLELACGFTPRGLRPQFWDKTFIAGDLPAVIEQIEPAYESLQAHGKVEYHPLDVTNYETLSKAIENSEGEIAIVSDGLLMYLTYSELKEYFSNIRRILLERGGYFLTPDPEVSTIYFGVMNAVNGPEFMEQLIKMQSTYSSKSDTDVGQNAMSIVPGNQASREKALDFKIRLISI